MSDCETVGLSILIPVYNERKTVRLVLERVRAVDFKVSTEIIVVDDGSSDGTTQLLQSLPAWDNVSVFHHEVNQGKGSAIQTALQHANGRIVVIQDADEELFPEDLLPMFEVVARGESAVCFGSRFARDVGRLRWRPVYWANRFLNGVCNLLNGLRLTDMNTCYKMMRADVARRLNLTSRGFAMEPEITTKLARMNIRVVERPIRYRPRSKAEGKKIRPMDFFRYLIAMVRFRFAWRKDRVPAVSSRPAETAIR
ncbi:MAG: glycosyltransferase family 2 protein [Phycisphaerales bacterium]|nr:glycosyltransferase family 2 protein [Phycisphaerales bacterium]